MAWLSNVTKHFLGFVNKFSFCYHSTNNKKIYETVYYLILKKIIFDLIFDLKFDTHDNPGSIFRFISVFGFFLFLISLCEQVLKTHQKHNCQIWITVIDYTVHQFKKMTLFKSMVKVTTFYCDFFFLSKEGCSFSW